jgi:hypothetical protein
MELISDFKVCQPELVEGVATIYRIELLQRTTAKLRLTLK